MSRFKVGEKVQIKGRPDLVVLVTRDCLNRFMPDRFYGRPLEPVEMSTENQIPYHDHDFEAIQ